MAKYFTNEQLSGQIVKEATFTVLKTSSSQEILDIPGGEDVVGTRWNSDGALMVDVIHVGGSKGRYFFLGQHVRYGGILPDDCSSNRPTSSSDLRRYMADVQNARQQREGRPSSSQTSNSSSSSSSSSISLGKVAVMGAGAVAVGAGKVAVGAGKLAAKGIEAAKEAHERAKEERAEKAERHREFMAKLADNGFLAEYQQELDKAEAEAEKIKNADMPTSTQEFAKVFQQSLKNLDKDSKKSALYTRLKGLGTTEDIDGVEDELNFYKASEIVLEAWQQRFDDLYKYGKDNFSNDDTIKKLLKENRSKTTKGKSRQALVGLLTMFFITWLVIGGYLLYDEGYLDGIFNENSIENYDDDYSDEEMLESNSKADDSISMEDIDLDADYDELLDMYEEAYKNDDFEVLSAVSERILEAEINGALTKKQLKRWEKLNR